MVDLGLISLMLWRKPGLCLETRFATDHTIPFRKDFQINAYHPQSSWKMKTEIFFFTKGAPAGDFVPGKAASRQCEGALTKERRVESQLGDCLTVQERTTVRRPISQFRGEMGPMRTLVGGRGEPVEKSIRESDPGGTPRMEWIDWVAGEGGEGIQEGSEVLAELRE